MFLDAQGNFVYADLVAMKDSEEHLLCWFAPRLSRSPSMPLITKKPLKQERLLQHLDFNLNYLALERSYMAEHQAAGSKTIYNPNLGV